MLARGGGPKITARTLFGRGIVFYEGECIPLSTFLSREISNFFRFFLNSFIFRSIVPQFLEHFPLHGPRPLPSRASLKEDPFHAALPASGELHAGSLGAAHCYSPGPHRSHSHTDRKARRADQHPIFCPLRLPCCSPHRYAPEQHPCRGH